MDGEKQKDEIIALESIYNEEEFSYHEENGRYQCTFKIFINLPPDYYLTYKDNRNPEEEEQKVRISHLPPLSLYVALPEQYPSTLAPKFTLHSSWLRYSLLSVVCKKLDKLWEENKGEEILFVWVAFLRDETLEFLNIQQSLKMDYAFTCYKKTLDNVQKNNPTDDASKESTSENAESNAPQRRKDNGRRSKKKNLKRKQSDVCAIYDFPIGRNPIQVLIDYSEKRDQIEFKKNFYTCKICFADKSGEHSTQFLPCSHVFCKDCISGYLEVRIKDGNVQDIRCPEDKCTSEATPAQIKDLVSSELFAKYDSILLSVTLDTMLDIVYCPRRNCQYPVSREPNEQMAKCPVCQYPFCIYCKMVYHGVEPCKDSDKLVNEYETASADKKLQMEQRFGKRQLQMLVENNMSKSWISTNSQKCPHCDAAIEKSDGCNKMTCWRCKTFFCWLCGTILSRKMPYLHFRDPKSKCYNMLYYGVIPDEGEEENEMFDFPFYAEHESEDEEFYEREDFNIEFYM